MIFQPHSSMFMIKQDRNCTMLGIHWWVAYILWVHFVLRIHRPTGKILKLYFAGNSDCSGCIFETPAVERAEINCLTLPNCLYGSDCLTTCKKCCWQFSCGGNANATLFTLSHWLELFENIFVSYNRHYTGWVSMNLIQEGKQATLVSVLFFTTNTTRIGILFLLLLLHMYFRSFLLCFSISFMFTFNSLIPAWKIKYEFSNFVACNVSQKADQDSNHLCFFIIHKLAWMLLNYQDSFIIPTFQVTT